MIDTANRAITKGDILLGIVLGLGVTLASGLGGTLGVYLGLPILGVVCLTLSWIWRNRLLRVFAVTITTLPVAIVAFFLIGNALEGGT